MNDQKSCRKVRWVLVYVLLSYPLNWLFLKWVFTPFNAAIHGPPFGEEEGRACFVMSPAALPLELLIMAVGGARHLLGLLF